MARHFLARHFVYGAIKKSQLTPPGKPALLLMKYGQLGWPIQHQFDKTNVPFIARTCNYLGYVVLL